MSSPKALAEAMYKAASTIQQSFRNKQVIVGSPKVKSPKTKTEKPAHFSIDAESLPYITKLAKKLNTSDLADDAKKLAVLAPKIGKDNTKYEAGKDWVLKLGQAQDALGAMVLLCAVDSAELRTKTKETWAQVAPDRLVEISLAMIDAVCDLCTNPSTIDLASMLGDQVS